MAASWERSWLMGSMRVWNKLRLGLPGIIKNTKVNKARRTEGPVNPARGWILDISLVGFEMQGAYLGGANLQRVNLLLANLQGAYLREVKGVTASQIKQARNWELAFYSDDFLKELDLPADHNETLEEKLAKIEKEKEKTATKP